MYSGLKEEYMEKDKGCLMLAGLPAFLAAQLTERFAQEGWKVLSMSDKIRSEKMDKLLAARRADVLVYLLNPKLPDAVGWLDRLLLFAYQADIGRVLLLSNADIFGSGRFVSEASSYQPQSRSGRRMRRLQGLADSWRRYEGMKITVMNLPELYGKGQKTGQGLLGRIVGAALDKTDSSIADVGQQAFLSGQDAAEGIWQWVESGNGDPVINLGPGTPLSWQEFSAIVAPVLPQGITLPGIRKWQSADLTGSAPRIRYGTSLLDGTYAEHALGWQMHTDDRAGIRDTAAAMVAGRQAAWEESRHMFSSGNRKQLLRRLIPYGENFLGAVLMSGVIKIEEMYGLQGYFDPNFLYIGTMGLLYGKVHSVLAAFLSIFLLSSGDIREGADLVGLLYDTDMVLHYVAYIVTAGVTGYFYDRNEFERQASDLHRERLNRQNTLLQHMLSDSLQIRDRLYRQIVNSDDSTGRIYRMVRKLDTVDREQIYTQAVMVTAEVLGVPDVAIYVTGSGANNTCLYRKAFCGDRAAARPQSLRSDDYGYLKDILSTKRTFMNRAFEEDAPDLAAPAVYEGRTIAVIEVYGLSFEQWSFNEQNLLSLTASLISFALSRAVEWERNRQNENNPEETRSLNRQEVH